MSYPGIRLTEINLLRRCWAEVEMIPPQHAALYNFILQDETKLILIVFFVTIIILHNTITFVVFIHLLLDVITVYCCY